MVVMVGDAHATIRAVLDSHPTDHVALFAVVLPGHRRLLGLRLCEWSLELDALFGSDAWIRKEDQHLEELLCEVHADHQVP